MSLPAPDLDSRKFQQIVNDAKRLILLRCPEWSDNNVSDPGVTLIELFAYMVESMFFQLNQVPEKNHIRFLELLGVKLEMPRPAFTDLRFLLGRPLSDGDPPPDPIPSNTVAATLRTDTEDPVEFLTDEPLLLRPPGLIRVFSAAASPKPSRSGSPGHAPRPPLPFKIDQPELYIKANEEGRPQGEDGLEGDAIVDPAFRIFGANPDSKAAPRPGDALYFGFDSDLAHHIVELTFDVAPTAARGLDRRFPNQLWETWDRQDNGWKRIPALEDSTMGFAESGVVRLEISHHAAKRTIPEADAELCWVRCRYTEILAELETPAGHGVTSYIESPAIRRVSAKTVGGHVYATHCAHVDDEKLGASDNRPGQRFFTQYSPVVLYGRDKEAFDESIWVGPAQDGANPELAKREGWKEWRPVRDFANSGKDDRHFVIDERTGEVTFGPLIPRMDDGPPTQYGAVPPEGHEIVLSRYTIGGGTTGNVGEGRIRVDKKNFSFIASVENPQAAQGGRDMETIERAKMRATKVLKVRNRAVTAADYVDLARERKGVGRAVCVQPTLQREYKREDDRVGYVPPGAVELLIVPSLGPIALPTLKDLEVPRETIDDVQRHLDELRLLTAALKVDEARYVFVETEVRIVVDPRLNADTVALAVRQKLVEFIHPLTGGPEGKGWPFGRALTLSDLYIQLSDVRGAHVTKIDLKSYDVGRPTGARFGNPSVAKPEVGLVLQNDQTLCTRDHVVRIDALASGRYTSQGD